MKISALIYRWIPEVYFMLVAIWWAIDSYTNWKGDINYPAIALFSIFTLQFFIKNRIIGLLLALMIGLVSIYLILALLSDFSKIPTIDVSGIRFLFRGGLFIVSNIIMSVLMFRNYSKTYKINEMSEA